MWFFKYYVQIKGLLWTRSKFAEITGLNCCQTLLIMNWELDM